MDLQQLHILRRVRAWAARSLTLIFVLTSSTARAQTNIVVSANVQRSVGGVGELDRAKYFNFSGTLQGPGSSNLGNLLQQTWSPTGLNTTTGRVATELDQFIATSLPEDPSKPGFFEHTALVNKIQGDYRNFVLSGSRWEGLRNYPEPILVQSGRNGGFWPDFLDDGGLMPTNYASYADFLNVYLEEAVYGTGPNQGFLPIDPGRFFLEVMNEPNWSSPSQSQWDEVIEMHQVVTELVKDAFPQAKIGGPSCCDNYESGTNSWDRTRQLMDDMSNWQTPSGDSVELDFWTIHPYERYDVAANGSYTKRVFTSPGHTAAVMDLYESYSNIKFGDPKAFAVTEYGSFNRTDVAGDYGDYARPEQQWDLVRDVREKMLIFMDRPDRIINATPFVSPKHWQNQVPTHPDGDNVFWEQNASGVWQETIVAGLFRMFNDVSGKYVDVSSDNLDFQSLAFRDGDQLYVLLNNLQGASDSIDLQSVVGPGQVTSASLDRVYWDGAKGVYESGMDVSGTWQNLTLAAEEGAVLTLTLDGPELYDLAIDQRTYYGDDVDTPLNLPTGRSKVINIAAELEDALSAKVRVAFNREDFTAGEGFFVFVNGNAVQIPESVLSFDDDDTDMVSREVDIPIGYLVDGNNEVYADFVGNGGNLLTAVLVLSHSIGDFNGSGGFDGEDLSLLANQFGPVASNQAFDLLADRVINMADIDYWLTELRGTTIGLGDFDLDGDIDAEDLALWQMGHGSASHYGQGDLDFDGDSDGTDFLALQRLLKAAASSQSAAATVPEAASLVLLLSGLIAGTNLCHRHASCG